MRPNPEAIAPETLPTARLEARFECDNGKTQMRHLFAAAPLKIAKTFAPDEDCGASLGVCIMDCSPGLLAGDYYQFDWNLQPGARVFITTQGFTRVHPSRQNPCRLNQNIRLERGAVLEWFPEPLLLFRDAALKSECEVEMESGATLLWAEITGAGRIGHGEAFQFHHLQNRWRVRLDNQLIFFNQTSLRPQSFDPKRVGAWQNFTHQGNFAIFSESADAKLLDALRGVLEHNPLVWGGASLLERGGITVALLGRRAHDLQKTMQHLRETAREFVFDF